MEKIPKFIPSVRSLLLPLLVSSTLSLGLLFTRWYSGHSLRYWFLIWNLTLAWFPILFVALLSRWLKKGSWLHWKGICLSILWLTFLPNAFYLITDFIHLRPTGEVSVLYDSVLFMTFALNGLILGYLSVYIVHMQLLKRLHARNATIILLGIFLLCSFAIYLGRYLTWNTWDIVVNPGGIIVDLSDRIVRPGLYPNTFTTTALFSITLPVLYYCGFKMVQAVRGDRN